MKRIDNLCYFVTHHWMAHVICKKHFVCVHTTNHWINNRNTCDGDSTLKNYNHNNWLCTVKSTWHRFTCRVEPTFPCGLHLWRWIDDLWTTFIACALSGVLVTYWPISNNLKKLRTVHYGMYCSILVTWQVSNPGYGVYGGMLYHSALHHLC